MTAVLALVALLAAPSSPSGSRGELVAAAAASGRPPECSSPRRVASPGSRGASVWQRARQPELGRYCDLLSRAHARLGSSPAKAKQLAEEADKLLPGRAAPSVLVARAALALGDPDEATRRFDSAKKLDPRSVEDPLSMHAHARALAASGRLGEALSVYRALVPRAGLLPSNEARVRVLLEAAHASMRKSGREPAREPAREPGREIGAPELGEAIAYLREARQKPPTALGPDVLLSLALALDRSGESAQADAALADLPDLRGQRRGPHDFAGSPEERAALDALALERFDRAAAAAAWEAYLAGPGGKGAFAAAARARLEALRAGRGRARRR